MKYKREILLVTLILLPVLIWAQVSNNGSIKGRVIDSKTGDPLPGANIIFLKTLLGASTDLEGNYFLSRIPVGTYKIKATMMGY